MEVFLYSLEINQAKEENLTKQAKRMGQPIPDRIKNKPKLTTGLNLYYDAFLELQFDRGQNDRIPWSIIVKYAEYYDFDEIQTERLIYFIRKLDEVFIKRLNKKRSKENENSS